VKDDDGGLEDAKKLLTVCVVCHLGWGGGGGVHRARVPWKRWRVCGKGRRNRDPDLTREGILFDVIVQ